MVVFTQANMIYYKAPHPPNTPSPSRSHQGCCLRADVVDFKSARAGEWWKGRADGAAPLNTDERKARAAFWSGRAPPPLSPEREHFRGLRLPELKRDAPRATGTRGARLLPQRSHHYGVTRRINEGLDLLMVKWKSCSMFEDTRGWIG